MKKSFFIFGFFIGISLNAQNTLNATFTSGHIPSSFDIYDDSCNGPSSTLIITLPAGDNYTVTSIDVAYSMTSAGVGFKSHQRSRIKFENSNIQESADAVGIGNIQGTQAYSRNIAIANGTYNGGTPLIFQMKARRTIDGVSGCNNATIGVNNNTWIITVNYTNVINNPKVGVNTSSPASSLDVNGTLKIGNSTSTAQAGTIRWNANTNDFEGYNGQTWLSFTKNEGGNWSKKDITEYLSSYASDGAADDRFGCSVSISGDYAIVGAWLKDVGANMNQGKAYIYARVGTDWDLQSEIIAGDGQGFDNFGKSVSIDGDYAIVGAPINNVAGNAGQGKAYIFKRNGSMWAQQSGITASDGAANDIFGSSVSISGDYVIVGAPNKDVGANMDQGKVYIYKRTGVNWAEQTNIVASDGAALDQYGYSVSMSGDYAIVGAPFNDVSFNNDQGSAYMLKRTGTIWAQQAIIFASNGLSSDKYGYSVSISGDYAIAGANSQAGNAYIYMRLGTNWNEQASIVASDGTLYESFGSSVSISGNFVIVGAQNKDIGPNQFQGKAYIFKRTNTNWVEQARFVASDGTAFNRFGGSVSISGDYAIIGADGKENGLNLDQGKVYFFKKE